MQCCMTYRMKLLGLDPVNFHSRDVADAVDVDVDVGGNGNGNPQYCECWLIGFFDLADVAYGIPARPSNASGPESLRGVNGFSSDVSERTGVSARRCACRPGGTFRGWVGCHPGMFTVALRARSSLLVLGAGDGELRVSSVSNSRGWSS